MIADEKMAERIAWHELGHYIGWVYIGRQADVHEVRLCLDDPDRLGVVEAKPGTMMSRSDDALIAILGPIMEALFDSTREPDHSADHLTAALKASVDGDLAVLAEHGYVTRQTDASGIECVEFTETGDEKLQDGFEVARRGMGFVRAVAPYLVAFGTLSSESLAGAVEVYLNAARQSSA